MKEIITQTKILLANVEATLNEIEGIYLSDKSVFQWTIGEQMHHMLSSLDNWFVNPSLNSGEKRNKKEISESELQKQFLIDYFGSIKKKIENYLDSFHSYSELHEKPKDCPYSKLELIMGQCRHAMYHIGFIHACLRIKTGSAPKYIGLDTYENTNN